MGSFPKRKRLEQDDTKGFRPINLSSFLLKTLDLHMEDHTNIPILREKKYLWGALFDMEAAYNNVKIEYIRRALEKLDE